MPDPLAPEFVEWVRVAEDLLAALLDFRDRVCYAVAVNESTLPLDVQGDLCSSVFDLCQAALHARCNRHSLLLNRVRQSLKVSAAVPAYFGKVCAAIPGTMHPFLRESVQRIQAADGALRLLISIDD